MADQCIVCLENLDTEPSLTPQLPAAVVDSSDPATAAETAAPAEDSSSSNSDKIAPENNNSNTSDVACIQVCGHMLHDICLREWSEKANSCPICRQSFHLVHVYDKVGGTLLSSYEVEDKKQVAEFDPQAWLDENPEEEELDTTPCPVCNAADQEDLLLLCDGCDTPYHTYCIGLDSVPHGAWFCMECVDHLGPEVAAAAQPPSPRAANRSSFFPRTQASVRRARQRARSDQWQGAWGQIAGRIWDALSIDLDYHDDDDDALEDYRRSQQLRERERQEHQRWQQRLNIASRLGARDVFANSIQNVFAPRVNPTPRPQPVEQTREEKRAWGAFEKARDSGESSSAARKRKSRSITASPGEPRQEPERKLKRPRTRRLPVQNCEASSSKPSPAAPSNEADAGGSISHQRPQSNGISPQPTGGAPSFLSSLLKEVELSTPSDDENIRQQFGPIPGANDMSSPASSPSASGYSSPRASSITPPPRRDARPTSPIMSLSSHIAPVYPPANYSPTRSSPDNSDSEHHSHRAGGASELRHPRPRRAHPAKLPRSQDVSPARSPLPLSMKESISGIVRSALKPHWKSSKLSAEQYASINRDVSRKLYEGVADGTSIDDEARRTWEKMARKEVARAVSEIKA
ncbi:hypothetical protein QBC33DRAFT_557412 [Phialemonium atrogriseum]|uniref:PHD and RING finger domain-containing protein n=1 Tax=Phialemonium atrogriseum TaxID=1093897 RepID=A0AAJ0C3Q2_9PEZI|nr:uncharacterized protein QBC33DRAFT_557412 [Phialemonium atrogriseum]KAK1769366.1 hypothetical protein QBC33DRAFT_557412 [Phialemonium atrogriseum]